ncbi:transglycosylase domain-containing protein [Desulfovibrio sp. OttesenSCG-928-G15]|nr:transglycosylase domain-containing protein [Desulfovibrio sp. OttesenSCG-928-G15]
MAVLAVGGLYAYCTKDMPRMEVFRNPAKHAQLLEAQHPIGGDTPYTIEPVRYEEIPELLVAMYLVSSNSGYFTTDGHDFGCAHSPLDALIMLFASDFFRSRDIDFYIRHDMRRLLTFRLAASLDKKQILCAYLNTMRYPGNAFGLKAGAQFLFNKNLHALSIAESATLMLLDINRWTNLERVLGDMYERRSWLLGRLRDRKIITQEEYHSAMAERISIPGLGIMK